MSQIGIRGAIDRSYILSLRGVASGSGSSSVTAALTGGSSVSFADGLRTGARLMSSAMQGLNATLTFTNLSRATLQDLGDLVDDMTVLVEKATKSSTGTQKRRKLDLQFQALAQDFRDIVEDAKLGEEEYFTLDGLTEIFRKVGLDPEVSKGFAAIFEKFVTPQGDDAFASEKTKAERPVSIPKGISGYKTIAAGYELSQSTIANTSNGAVYSGGVVYGAQDTVLLSNPDYAGVFIEPTDGSTAGFDLNELSADVQVLKVDESTGYSLVVTNQDLLSTGSTEKQLFLVDSSGNAVHQYTELSAGAEIYAADFSRDYKDVVVSFLDSGSYDVEHVSVSTLGQDPSTANTYTNIEQGAGVTASVERVGVSNDGSHFYYRDEDARTFYYMDSSYTADATISGLFNLNNFAIIDSDTVIYHTGSDVYRLQYGGAATSILTTTMSNTSLVGLEDSDLTDGAFAFEDGSGVVRVYEGGLTGAASEVASYTLGASDTVTRLSLAARDSRATLGILGTLPSVAGDTDTELYEFAYQSAQTVAVPVRLSAEATRIFEPGNSIRERADAYRMLEDLEELKSQIEKNLEVLEEAALAIADNMDLVRATGLAMLQLEGQLTGEEEADDVAKQLRTLIRRDTNAAMTHAENLEPMTVAALTFDEDTFST